MKNLLRAPAADGETKQNATGEGKKKRRKKKHAPRGAFDTVKLT